MIRLGGRQDRGFSLIETIVAAVILGGAVVSIGSISSRALVATRLNRQYETAASIIDRQMAVIQFAGVDQLVNAGQMDGRVDDIPPGYQWAASAAYEGIDALYTVTVTVQWADQGKGYTLSADTQMNGPSTITTNDTSQTTTQGTTSGTSTQAAVAASQ
jgi:prepilin-type N-terminal cleavage/methylation domain-containing protein